MQTRTPSIVRPVNVKLPALPTAIPFPPVMSGFVSETPGFLLARIHVFWSNNGVVLGGTGLTSPS